MPDDLRTRIAAVLQNHRQGRFAEWMTCSCDGHWSRFASAVYDGHVADAVIRELEADYILVPKGHTIARIRSAEKLGLTGDGE